jgi:hypothetical protein
MMEFKKCFECVLCRKFEPGINLNGALTCTYILICMATGEKLEVTKCVKENHHRLNDCNLSIDSLP